VATVIKASTTASLAAKPPTNRNRRTGSNIDAADKIYASLTFGIVVTDAARCSTSPTPALVLGLEQAATLEAGLRLGVGSKAPPGAPTKGKRVIFGKKLPNDPCLGVGASSDIAPGEYVLFRFT
jgi:hypothetical protein